MGSNQLFWSDLNISALVGLTTWGCLKYLLHNLLWTSSNNMVGKIGAHFFLNYGQSMEMRLLKELAPFGTRYMISPKWCRCVIKSDIKGQCIRALPQLKVNKFRNQKRNKIFHIFFALAFKNSQIKKIKILYCIK